MFMPPRYFLTSYNNNVQRKSEWFPVAVTIKDGKRILVKKLPYDEIPESERPTGLGEKVYADLERLYAEREDIASRTVSSLMTEPFEHDGEGELEEQLERLFEEKVMVAVRTRR